MGRFTLAFALASLPLVTGGCKASSNPVPPVSDTDPGHPELGRYVPPPMEVHFVTANDMQRAIMHGDLEAAKSHARWIVENTVNDHLPVRWRPNVPPITKAARGVMNAPDLVSAAASAGEMAAACGHCHRQMGMPLTFAAKDAPPGPWDQRSHMKRHQWAADRLWEGLVGPSDESWRRGAKALLETPLLRDADRVSGPNDKQALADRVHALGSSAISTTDPAQRAGLYGELLGTCATCHG